MASNICLFPSHQGLSIKRLKCATSEELDFYYDPLRAKLPTSCVPFLLNLVRNHAVFEILSDGSVSITKGISVEMQAMKL